MGKRRDRGRLNSFLIGGLAIAASVVAFIVWQSIGSKSLGEDVQPEVLQKITIANIGEYSLLNLVAADQGFFKKYGLDASVVEYDAGPSSVGALLAGKADFAVAADFVGVTNIWKDPRVRIIAETSKHDVFRVLARRDRGIDSPGDLRGKRIAVTRKSAGEFYLGRFLTFNDLKLEDVRIQDLPPAEIVRAIETGTADAVVIFNPHAYDIKRNLGDVAIEWSAQAGQKTFALAYSTDSFVREHPAAVESYLRALADAERFVASNPDDAKAILGATRKSASGYIDAVWGSFAHRLGLSQELLLTMEDQARWSTEHDLTPEIKTPNYLDFIYQDALRKVNPAAVSILK